jgi:hypothetical protein
MQCVLNFSKFDIFVCIESLLYIIQYVNNI